MGFSLLNQQFWGSPISGNPHWFSPKIRAGTHRRSWALTHRRRHRNGALQVAAQRLTQDARRLHVENFHHRWGDRKRRGFGWKTGWFPDFHGNFRVSWWFLNVNFMGFSEILQGYPWTVIPWIPWQWKHVKTGKNAWFCGENLQEAKAFPIFDTGGSSNLSLQFGETHNLGSISHTRKSPMNTSIKYHQHVNPTVGRIVSRPYFKPSEMIVVGDVQLVMGVPPVVIHFRLGSSRTPKPSSELGGYPHDELGLPPCFLAPIRHPLLFASFFVCVFAISQRQKPSASSPKIAGVKKKQWYIRYIPINLKIVGYIRFSNQRFLGSHHSLPLSSQDLISPNLPIPSGKLTAIESGHRNRWFNRPKMLMFRNANS